MHNMIVAILFLSKRQWVNGVDSVMHAAQKLQPKSQSIHFVPEMLRVIAHTTPFRSVKIVTSARCSFAPPPPLTDSLTSTFLTAVSNLWQAFATFSRCT